MHKSSSFNGLLNGDGLQSRWRQTNGTSFIRRKNRFKFQFVYLIAIILLILIIYLSVPTTKKALAGSYIETTPSLCATPLNYNSTYPLTRPIVNPHNHFTIYRVGIIADLDTNSKKDKAHSSYSSYLKRGHLTIGPSLSTFEFKWDSEDSKEISSGYALKGKQLIRNLIRVHVANCIAWRLNIYLLYNDKVIMTPRYIFRTWHGTIRVGDIQR